MTSFIQKKRFHNELVLLKKEPLHYATAYPDEENMLIWYFLIKGQNGTDYENGEYIGKIVHSNKYPTEPPDYYMLTPNGRFSTNQKICVTTSSYHKSEWSSTWNIKTILIGFYSIWLDDVEHGISHIKCSKLEREQLANNSNEYNLKNHKNIYEKFNLENIYSDYSVFLKKNSLENNIKAENTKLEDNIKENTKLEGNINEITSKLSNNKIEKVDEKIINDDLIIKK